MLFNSYPFIFFFVPITLIVFFQIGNGGHHKVAIAWLVGASLFFYGWWNPAYLGLLIGSILLNYAIGITLANYSPEKIAQKKIILTLGIGINLGLLGYFKYANFFIENINHLFGSNLYLDKIILPLAISFFTFQQITYLIDTYRGFAHEYNFLHYCLFVTFFPQLIAGPIVHHSEMMPQFAKDSIYRFNHKRFAIGITIFFIGLFKKVIIADGIAPFGNRIFDAGTAELTVSFLDAWTGALAYTFQLYFDFSGYSDMAIGLAHLFCIRLPLNFNSPYKATNIIDFWRRWHMTLSRVMRDYLYIPLGGNREGNIRTLVNLFITMLLGGLWHGAGWTFIIWGGVHGIYIIINHLWRQFKKTLGLKIDTWWSRGGARVLTFIALVVGWVFFRAESMDGAFRILKGMVGVNGFVLPLSFFDKHGSLVLQLKNWGFHFSPKSLAFNKFALIWIVSLLAIVWLFPNTQQIMAQYKPAFEIYTTEIKPVRWSIFQWKPNLVWAGISALICIYAILNLTNVSDFLYFQF